MSNNLNYELLNIIDNQENIIIKQKDIIANLINENAEKENMINCLMEDEYQ